MKARLITRCGCERYIKISAPPPPTLALPLKPPKFNEGRIRSWMSEDSATNYDPLRDGLETRQFRLSLESLDMYYRDPQGTEEVWYDEMTQYDPPGFNVGQRTYAP